MASNHYKHSGYLFEFRIIQDGFCISYLIIS